MDKNLELKLRNKADELLKKYKSVGASVVLFDNNNIIYKQNYGYINKADKVETSDESMFMIGSNTKVLTALAIFKLYEENKLSLDDDIKKYIPEFKVNSLIEYDKITIGNLLMHRGGIQCDLYDFIFNDKEEYHNIIKALENTYLTSKPGTMFAYSNIGYTLLGIIIENISGLSYVDYINEYIAKPLNIDVRFIMNSKDFTKDISLSYDKKKNVTKDLCSTMIPAGSNTYMKIIDLAKVGQMFLNDGLVNGNIFLKKETIDLMKTLNLDDEMDKLLNNGGYGLLHNTEEYGDAGKVYGHGGDTVCHHSSFIFIPNKNIGAITFTNTENATRLSRVLSRSLLKIYLENNGFVIKNYSTEHKHVVCNTDNYVGKFSTIFGLLNIKYDKKNVLVTKLTGLNIKLIPCEDGYLQAYPNCRGLKKLLFGKLIKSIRFKLCNYYGEEVLILEQVKGYQRAYVIIGDRYIENTNNDTLWHKALGEYEIINLDFKKKKMKLLIEEDRLKLIVDLDSEKIIKYLYIINDNLAISQGYGRDSREACHLEEKDGIFYITCSGVTGKLQLKK